MSAEINKDIAAHNNDSLRLALSQRESLSYGMQHYYLMNALKHHNSTAFELFFERFNLIKSTDYGILLSSAIEQKNKVAINLIVKKASENDRIFDKAFTDTFYHFINKNNLNALSALIRALKQEKEEVITYANMWKDEFINLDILSGKVLKYFRKLGLDIEFSLKEQRIFLSAMPLHKNDFTELFKGCYLDVRFATELVKNHVVANKIHQSFNRKKKLSHKERIYFLSAQMYLGNNKAFLKHFKESPEVLSHSQDMLTHYLECSQKTPVQLMDKVGTETQAFLLTLMSEDLHE